MVHWPSLPAAAVLGTAPLPLAHAEPVATPTALAAGQASPAEDIAGAATLCLAALNGDGIDSGRLLSEGWIRQEGRDALFTQPGNNVRIFAGIRKCVVDTFGESADSFDSIRDSIHD